MTVDPVTGAELVTTQDCDPPTPSQIRDMPASCLYCRWQYSRAARGWVRIFTSAYCPWHGF
jgi:hypothetical protein